MTLFGEVKVNYKGPLYSPIAKGSKIATLSVDIKNYRTLEYSLFAQENIDKSGYLRRMTQILRYKIRNFLQNLGILKH